MLTCPSNASAAALEFATTAAQYGDTAEQMLGKLLAGRAASPVDTVEVTVTGGAAVAEVVSPRAGRNSILITADSTNTLPVYWVTGPGPTYAGAASTGHQILPGGVLSMTRAGDGNLDDLYIWVSQASGSGIIAITDR